MLAELTSKQIGDWLAFGQLEQIGTPVPPDPEEVKKAEAKAKRDKFEGGMRNLMNKDG